MKVKVAVIGSGAMGSLYGGRLTEKNEVFLIDVWQEHIDKINESGLTTQETDGTSTIVYPQAVSSAKGLPVMDLVLIFVKSIHTRESVLQAEKLIGPETLILTLQNGYGNDQDIMAVAKPERIIIGTTSHGCTMKGPGLIYHAGSGITTIGSISGDVETAEKTAKILRSGGFEVKVDEDIKGLVFHKLFINAGINALTAIFDVPNGLINENPELKEASGLLIKEAVRIAAADGMDFNEDEVFQSVLDVAVATAGNISSMRADIQKQRQTEIDKINGAFVRLADEHGLEAPANRLITKMIHFMESRYPR